MPTDPLTTFALPALVTVGTAFLLGAVAINVGRERVAHKVPPPLTDGPEPFIRALRAQANTTEQALIFLPSLWMFAFYVDARWAGVLGLLWIAARVAYAVGYPQGPAHRWPWRRYGFGVSFVVTHALAFGAALAVARLLWRAAA